MKAVTESALLRRLNRKLHHEEQQVHKTRPNTRADMSLGPYYVRNWRINGIDDMHLSLADVVELAREEGCLAAGETVVGQ